MYSSAQMTDDQEEITSSTLDVENIWVNHVNLPLIFVIFFSDFWCSRKLIELSIALGFSNVKLQNKTNGAKT